MIPSLETTPFQCNTTSQRLQPSTWSERDADQFMETVLFILLSEPNKETTHDQRYAVPPNSPTHAPSMECGEAGKNTGTILYDTISNVSNKHKMVEMMAEEP
jgi:hypothetical protein